jgi:uncharacterized protein (TIGR02453 family)
MSETSSQKFSGFSAAALKFLRDLATHNDRAWFVPRKHIFETELQEPLRAMVADASEAMRKAKIKLGADPTRATFRIYRDVRFSRDKSPYKTNLGAYLSSAGVHDEAGGLYVHIQPKKCFMAVAFYQLDKPALQRWRTAMAEDPGRFQAMLKALKRNGLSIAEDGDALKRMPRGFEAHADSPIAKYFRQGSFMISERLTDEDVKSKRLISKMVALAKKAKPLLEYGRSV